MQEDVYHPDEVYYALVEALDQLRPLADAEGDGGSTIKMILGEVGGIWPAWVKEEESSGRSPIQGPRAHHKGEATEMNTDLVTELGRIKAILRTVERDFAMIATKHLIDMDAEGDLAWNITEAIEGIDALAANEAA